ncbi:MAG: putative peptidoglycan glycosyltransferase FtsW [Pseudomonadota bacterium]|nr:putative peptidoglycan glycosyltransferase FtsW [Pseudomonadota bacterium]
MIALARTDTSLLGRWWWTVDRWLITCLLLIIAMGAILVLAASPSVAERIGLDAYHFVRRQFIILPLALTVMFAVSLLSPLQVRRLAAIGFLGCVVLLALTPLVGAEIKGARRWISLAGMSLQVSEFVKPCLAVISAWMFAEWRRRPEFPGHGVAIALYTAVVGLLLLQPDFGQSVLITLVFIGQFFLAGLPVAWLVATGALGLAGLVGAYFLFPHVTSRVNRFLDPTSGDTYQVDRSLEAFINGGFLGTGPGEGEIKQLLPDAHADFIFSVAGEEFGAITCLLIIVLFGFVVLRGFSRLFADGSLFVLLAGAGLLMQFGLQALVHMASALQLAPAKGMTLPFISYGGSSLIALALAMGMALALTRRRVHEGDGA